MHRFIVAALALGSLVACGEDKDYGDPLTDPNAPTIATASVTNASFLQTDTTNESSLNVLNGLSGNYNQLTGIKYQAGQGQAGAPAPRPLSVDENCVVQTDTDITWTDCLWAENTVNGSITREGTAITIDVNFFREDAEQMETNEIDATGEIDISATAMVGDIHFDWDMQEEDFRLSSEFDGYYDVVLAEGCPVGGQVEVRGHVSSTGVSQTIWVMAEFGPACGDVVVR